MTDETRRLLDKLDHNLNDILFDLVDENETLEGQVNELREQVARLTENKGDLISRQAVLDELEKWDWQDLYLPIHFKQILDNVPSVENKGEWVKIQSGDKDFPESIVCSKCKNENSHLDFNEHGEPIGKVFVTSKFCPNCGADMRGE